ncbi:hypothetical protein BGM26_10620 [Bacillus sp. FJAT-29790]|uniref:hypothetical protein n=1 Tax=Bacillus sp. FJAT-29790 TaxID=1895002 RepID=UPI001C218004|nr:hypothetical protein [Bacillus sp. FJAT-29790]MBU8879437.1 hypothetical protein [Bacillus sp. FJAT-29790]
MRVLFENPIILFLIITAISTLFKKRKEKENNNRKTAPNQQQTPMRPSTEKPIQDPYFEARKFEDEEIQARNVTDLIEKEYLEKKKRAEAKIKALKEQQRNAEKKAQAIQATAPIRTLQPSSPLERENKANQSTREQKLVDGIIWSEILGPPRARNPHRSIKGK